MLITISMLTKSDRPSYIITLLTNKSIILPALLRNRTLVEHISKEGNAATENGQHIKHHKRQKIFE